MKHPQHRIFGDGSPIGNSLGAKIKMLIFGGVGPVSVDGYRAVCFRGVLARRLKKQDCIVAIGHPKALSPFGVQRLREALCFAKKEGALALGINRQSL